MTTRSLLGFSLAVLCASLACTREGPGGVAATPAPGAAADKLVVAMMPKNKGNPYFVGARQGA